MNLNKKIAASKTTMPQSLHVGLMYWDIHLQAAWFEPSRQKDKSIIDRRQLRPYRRI